jgi:hypothetical protein
MRVVIAILVLVTAVSAFCWLLTWIMSRAIDAGKRRQPWKLDTKEDGGWVTLVAVRPFRRQVLLSEPMESDADDFDMKLYEAKSMAREKVREMNGLRKELS